MWWLEKGAWVMTYGQTTKKSVKKLPCFCSLRSVQEDFSLGLLTLHMRNVQSNNLELYINLKYVYEETLGFCILASE